MNTFMQTFVVAFLFETFSACSHCLRGHLSLLFSDQQLRRLKKVHQKIQVVAAEVLCFPLGTAAVVCWLAFSLDCVHSVELDIITFC